MFHPLRHRDFRLLWIGQSVSLLGNAIYGVALPFQILDLGGTPVQLGAGYAVYAAIQLVVILFGGAVVDRLPRRRVILISDLVSALVIGLVAALGVLHLLRIEHLYLASAFFGLASSFYLPAMSAIVPELVPKELLVAGNSLRSLSRQVARVSGPFVGGLIVVAVGPPSAFAIDAATFLFSFLVFLAARPVHVRAAGNKPLVAAMREGLGFVFSVPWIWISIVGFGFVNAFYIGAFSVGVPLVVREVLHGGAATFGLIGSTAGIGQVVASIALGNLRLRRLGPTMYGCYALTAFALILYAIPNLPGVLLGAVAFSAGLTAANTLWESALQRNVPHDLIGRVTSVDYFGSFLIGPAAPFIAAAVIERAGPGAIFVPVQAPYSLSAGSSRWYSHWPHSRCRAP